MIIYSSLSYKMKKRKKIMTSALNLINFSNNNGSINSKNLSFYFMGLIYIDEENSNVTPFYLLILYNYFQNNIFHPSL